MNASIAPFKNQDFVLSSSLAATEHEICVQEFDSDTKSSSESLSYTLVALKKASAAILETTSLCLVDKAKLKENYAEYVEKLLSPAAGRDLARRLEPKSKYFKGDNRAIIAMLNTFLRKSAKIAREIGFSGIYQYCTLCSSAVAAEESMPRRERIREILQNVGEKLVKPFISHPGTRYSAKTRLLIEFLRKYMQLQSPEGSATPSCIVFVDERLVAHVLHRVLAANEDLFPGPQKPVGLVMGHTMGQGARKVEYREKILRAISTVVMDSEDQLQRIEQFKQKLTRVLIATDVVEEGLDVPSCNLVCCFNPIKNVKSFVQMQGRAREADSQFVVLTPKDKTADLRKRIGEFKATIATSQQLALYADKGISPEASAYQRFQMSPEEYLEVPSTGAKVCVRNARSFLNRYCQALPADEFCKPFAEYAYDEVKPPNMSPVQYIAIVTLPPMVPKELRCVRGKRPAPSKGEAADLVAFEIVQRLYTLRKINRFLLSTSKYGGDLVFNDAACEGKAQNQTYIGTPILNETSPTPPEQKTVVQFLYGLTLDPRYPYLSQDTTLGFLFFRYAIFPFSST